MPKIFSVDSVIPNQIDKDNYEDLQEIILTSKEYKNKAAGDYLSSSSSEVKYLSCMNNNGFVGAALRAYNNHYFLGIRPDDVWLSIMVQFARYVNGNGEQLRDKFVSHEDQIEIKTTTGGGMRTAGPETWAAMSKDIARQCTKYLKDSRVKDWIIPDFSTTTDKDRTVASMVMMGAFQKYFTYGFQFLCGIPYVILAGEEKDWADVRERAKQLLNYDTNSGIDSGEIKKWYKSLSLVLDKFVESFDKPDIGFWKKICLYHGGSGAHYISGWISAFLWFDEDGKPINRETMDEIFPGLEDQLVKVKDVVSGFISVPIEIDDNGAKHKGQIFAGHIACSGEDQHIRDMGDVSILHPELDWVICLVDEENIERNQPDRSFDSRIDKMKEKLNSIK